MPISYHKGCLTLDSSSDINDVTAILKSDLPIRRLVCSSDFHYEHVEEMARASEKIQEVVFDMKDCDLYQNMVLFLEERPLNAKFPLRTIEVNLIGSGFRKCWEDRFVEVLKSHASTLERLWLQMNVGTDNSKVASLVSHMPRLRQLLVPCSALSMKGVLQNWKSSYPGSCITHLGLHIRSPTNLLLVNDITSKFQLEELTIVEELKRNITRTRYNL